MRKILLAGNLFFVLLVSGQDTLRISQSEMIQKLNSQNLQMKMANQSYESARADYRQSHAVYLPNITASHTAISTNNPLMAFGSKLNQGILTQNDFNPSLLNNPNLVQNFATRIEILQPVFNADGIYERKAAKSKMEAYKLQNERSNEYWFFESQKAFMELQLSYKAFYVIQNAYKTAQSNLDLVTRYYQEGMLQKTDLLAVQVRILEISNQLAFAKSNIQNASDYLAYLLDETMENRVFLPNEDLENTMVPSDNTFLLSDSRKDILAMEKTSESYQNMMNSGKMSFLPRLNAFGTYELYDRNLFQFGANGYTIGAQLSWNLFDGYKTVGKFEKSKAEFQKAKTELEHYKKQSQLELNKTNRLLLDAENKVKLTKLAFEQTQEGYRIFQNRFSQGLEKTTDLLMTETQMAQKELEHLQAVFEFNLTRKYLDFLAN